MTYITAPYTPERIESLRFAEPHNAGDPMPNDVAMSNTRAILEGCERVGAQPDEVGLDAMGGVAMYWDNIGLHVYAFNSGSIVESRSMLHANALASPADAVALAAAQVTP